MRWVHLIIVIVFVAAIVLFVVQNVQMTTMSFLGFSIRAPLAVLAAVVYILGALTGGSLFALLRTTIRGTKAGWPGGERR
jgi:lipopolysaccharide assembly protein A